MAKRRKRRGESVMGYFRTVFGEHPEWLNEKSNAATLARYRQDHGLAEDAPLDKKITSNLANLKSVLRKQQREGGAGRRTATAVASNHTRGGGKLEGLEEMIDDALTQAKTLDREGLRDVIGHLRRARNLVVWKLGQ
jgi:hypothetical protein